MEVDLKALRAKLQWSQNDLAHFLRVADTTVNRWETGAREPTGRLKDDLHTLAAIVHTSERATEAIQAAARRGETIRTLVVKALERLGEQDTKGKEAKRGK